MNTERPLRALIVDDEADLCAMLALRLHAAGFDARFCADGAEGLALAREWKPDVILADLQMPGLDGWQLCEKLAADRLLARLPVVLMTAWNTPEASVRAKAAGAAAVLLKPFDERRLASALRALVARRRRRALTHADKR